MWPVALLHTAGALSPTVLLFVAAVVSTLLARLRHRFGVPRAGAVGDRELRETVCVVAYVRPGESVEPYVQLLTSARVAARVRLHLHKSLARDEPPPALAARGVVRTNVRLAVRYAEGVALAAAERARLLAEAATADDACKYTLLLGQPVEAEHGWDELLLAELALCSRPGAAVLTTRLAAAEVVSDATGTFLHVDSVANGSCLAARPFANPPSRPQPSLFCSASFAFGRSELFAKAVPSEEEIGAAAHEDFVLTRALWTHGIDFWAPRFACLHAVATSLDVDATAAARRAPDEARSAAQPGRRAAATRLARSTREWAVYAGRASDGAGKWRWRRRARLGLTPQATHEERHCKFGTGKLEAHGL